MLAAQFADLKTAAEDSPYRRRRQKRRAKKSGSKGVPGSGKAWRREAEGLRVKHVIVSPPQAQDSSSRLFLSDNNQFST